MLADTVARIVSEMGNRCRDCFLKGARTVRRFVDKTIADEPDYLGLVR